MDLKRVDVKLFTASGRGVTPAKLIPVLHGFIQRRALGDELLIDVASYGHVAHGPSVVLVGHEGLYAYDETKGRPGLLYSLRRGRSVDDLRGALSLALRRVTAFCALLEADANLSGQLAFDRAEVLVRLNDRLRAPNTEATWDAVAPDVRAAIAEVMGDGYQARPEPGVGEPFTVRARVSA